MRCICTACVVVLNKTQPASFRARYMYTLFLLSVVVGATTDAYTKSTWLPLEWYST